MNKSSSAAPTFRPLVDACKDHGISRTVAYELVNEGLLDTFVIGVKRYVYMESLRTLPDRLAKKPGGRN